MMDCIYFSNLCYLLLKHYNKKYGNDFKYLSIKIDKWGDGDNDFHQFITFKYNDIWYYLDRFECKILENKKGLKKIGLEQFNGEIHLAVYRLNCGFKSIEEAQNNIFEVVNKHLFELTKLSYHY